MSEPHTSLTNPGDGGCRRTRAQWLVLPGQILDLQAKQAVVHAKIVVLEHRCG